MLKKQLLYRGFAIIGTLFFVLAMALPVFLALPFVGTASVWTLSPLICSAAIAFVALAASFPLWCAKSRAWLVPFVVSFLILVLDIPCIISVVESLLNPNVPGNSFLSVGGSAPVSLIPIYSLTLSFSMMLAGALVARKMRNPSVASIEAR